MKPVHKVHSFEAVGAGDAFAGALLHSLVRGFEPQKLIDFSISASVLKLMIQRDFNLVTENEIMRVMESKSGKPAKVILRVASMSRQKKIQLEMEPYYF